MHGLGYNRFAAKYLSRVANSGTLPQVTTPWVVNKFAADFFSIFKRVVYAAYPHIGGTAAAHAIDLFGDHDLTWSGTVTHNANGVAGNGSDGKGVMLDNLSDIITSTQKYSHGLYCKTNTAVDKYDCGCSSVGAGATTIQCRNVAGDTRGYCGVVGVGASTAIAASTGFFVATRPNTTSVYLYRAGVLIASNATGATGSTIGRQPYAVCAYQTGSMTAINYTSRNYAFNFVAGHISSADSPALYNIVLGLQTHLGRQN